MPAATPDRLYELARSWLRTLTAAPLPQPVFDALLEQAMQATPMMVAGLVSRVPQSNVDVFARLQCPVGFVLGDRDSVITLDMPPYVKASVPHLQTFIYAGIGHLPQTEAADTFADDLSTFARRSLSAAPAV